MKLTRLLALLLALAMMAAACGSDSSESSSDADADAGDSNALSADSDDDAMEDDEAMDDDAMEDDEAMDDDAMEDDEAMDDDAMEDDEAMDDDAMEDDEAMDDDAMEDDEAMDDGPAGLADDAVDGKGAERLESMILNPVGPADDSLEPVLITMANLEGDALGSFPEIREGLEIAVADINENWGGIGGRPIELDVCVHGFDPNAAINCGNEIAEASPNLNINGIEFFTPALWPTFLGANIPTMQTVPIFVSDFTVTGNGLSPFGGCPVAFPSAATYTMEFLELDKVAVVYANTPPGLECYADTEERFWDYLVDNEVDGEYVGIPDNAGDPSDDDAIVQQIADFFGDTPADSTAVFFGTQASDCNAIMSAVSAAGLDTQIIASGSCIDDSVLSNPAAVGAQFGNQARISTRPDLYPGFPEFELNWRNDLLESSDLRSTPVSAFLRVGHTSGVFAWNMFNDMLDAGEDIDDPAAVIAWMNDLNNVHLIANNPLSCGNNTEEFPAVCKKDNTFVVWDGEGWDPEGSPLGGEYFSVDDIQARVAAGNPRPDAG